MAGKKCPQCAETVKVEALVCRFCGHRFPEPQPKKPMGLGKKVLIGLGVLVGIGVVRGTPTAPPATALQEKADTDLKKALGRDPKNDPRAIIPSSSATSDLGGLAILTGASLKKSARDPDSLVIERAFGRTEESGVSYVCVLYRARNGFGGMNRDHVVFSAAGGDQSSRSWNKYCTKPDGYDNVTSGVEAGASMRTG